MSKVLLLDIETAPTLAYVWKLWKENVGQEQILGRGYIMSCTIKFLDSDEVIYLENRTKNDYKIVFFSWIQENKPELLNFNCEGDKWQKIQTMLSDFS